MFRKFYYQKFISFDNKIRINKTKSGLKSSDFSPLRINMQLFPLGLGSLGSVKVATSLHDFILYLCGFFDPPFLLSENPVLKMYSEGSIGLQDNYSEKQDKCQHFKVIKLCFPLIVLQLFSMLPVAFLLLDIFE